MARLSLLVVLVACGRTEPLDGVRSFTVDAGPLDAGRDGGSDAGRDAGLPDAGPPDASVPTSCTNAPGPAMGRRCRLRVRFDALQPSGPTCFIDVRVDAGEVGSLEWDCGGSQGRAELRFARTRFTGVIVGDDVDLCFGSEFDWTDGCRWTSAQTISGTISAGRLGLTYGEAPLAGQIGCVVPCSASGSLTVMP